LLATGLAGPALGVTCYQWALLDNATGVVLPIIAITPLVVIPMSIAFKEEKPTLRSLIGGIIAVGGVVGMVMITKGGS
jgi:drug/metabolite transporter (DMT)-like permease